MENKCQFCMLSVQDDLKYGKFLTKGDVSIHYFCMLFSSALPQRGKTDEHGFLGFMIPDIKKEVKRGARLRCSYCNRIGATIGCAVGKCRIRFHLPCGRANGSLHQYYNSFPSYCREHRPHQLSSPESVTDEEDGDEETVTTSPICPICMVPVVARVSITTLKSPCCKNGWFHNDCIQQQALASGYFFKCPLCNNKQEFKEEMLYYGIYIPEQDAAWELEENAYQDLYVRPNECNQDECLCPDGRAFSDEGKWDVLLCTICGSKGSHMECGNISTVKPTWDCNECLEILKKGKEGKKGTNMKHKGPLLPSSRRMVPPSLMTTSTNVSPHKSMAVSAAAIKRALEFV